MSFPSTSPSPANLLADKSWRRRHSAWLLAPILGCGMLSFVGFLYVAIRVQTRKFWIAATIGCVGSAAVWIVMALTGDLEESSDAAGKAAESTSSTSDLGAGVALAVWAALLVYAFVLNRDYLRWRAGLFESQAWYNQPAGNAATGQNAELRRSAGEPRLRLRGFWGSTRTTTLPLRRSRPLPRRPRSILRLHPPSISLRLRPPRWPTLRSRRVPST